jgi:hypothetical protein
MNMCDTAIDADCQIKSQDDFEVTFVVIDCAKSPADPLRRLRVYFLDRTSNFSSLETPASILVVSVLLSLNSGAKSFFCVFMLGISSHVAPRK